MEIKGKEIDVIAVFKQVLKKRKKIALYGCIGGLIGMVVAFSIPKQYQASIKIAPESKTQPVSGSANALAGMFGMSGAMVQAGIGETLYPEVIRSSPFAMEFADINVVYNEQSIPLWKYLLENQKQPWWNYIVRLPRMVAGWFGSSIKDVDINTSEALQQKFVATLGSVISFSTGINIRCTKERETEKR